MTAPANKQETSGMITRGRVRASSSVRAIVLIVLLAGVLGAGSAEAQEMMQVAQNAPGFQPAMVYQDFGKGESVNAFNGGLVVTHRSAIAVPENLGGSFNPVRTFNSKSVEGLYSYATGAEGPAHGWMGRGWTLSFGRVFLRLHDVENPNAPPAYLTRLQWFYQDESGAEHRLYLRYDPNTHDPYTGIEPYDGVSPNPQPTANHWYVTNDGSYIRAKFGEGDNPGNWRLYFPDGSTRILGGANAYLAPRVYNPAWFAIRNRYQQGWYTTSIRDRAANVTSIQYRPYQPDPTDRAGHPYRGQQPYMGSVDRVTDPFGRIIAFEVFTGQSEGSQKNGLLSAIGLQGAAPAMSESYDYASFPVTLPPNLANCPELIQVTDPASLQTRYDYGQFPYLGGYSYSVLRRIDYPTGGSVAYTYAEWTYVYNRCRQIPVCEPLLDDMFGVETRTEYGAPAGGPDNTATWKWGRDFGDIGGGIYGISSQIRVIPVIATDPLGQQTVHFFSCSDSSVPMFPPGLEMAAYTYAPGYAFLKTSPAYGRAGQKNIVFSFGGGDANRCVEEWFASSPDRGWYIGPGNSRTRKTVEGEYTAGASTPLWSKVVQNDVWDGYGHYLLTQTTGTNLSQTWVSARQYNLKLGTSGQPYQLDRLVTSYSGTGSSLGNMPALTMAPVEPPEPTLPILVSGQFRATKQEYQDATPVPNAGLLWRRWQMRAPAADFWVYIAPPSLTPPSVSSADPKAALVYQGQGNIASVQYSGGQAGNTYSCSFGWLAGMVNLMTWAGVGHNEFTREIDGTTGRIVSETGPDQQTTTGFSYDALGRLTTITPPGGDDPIRVAYPLATKSRTLFQESHGDWVIGNRIYYYKGPLGAAPALEYPASPAGVLGTRDLYTLYAFDDWGRLGRTDRVLPGDTWSRTEAAYDPFGQGIFSSEAFNPAAPPSRWGVTYPLAVNMGSYTVNVPQGALGPALGTWTSFFGDADYLHPFGVTSSTADPFHRSRWTLRAGKGKTQTEYNPNGQGLATRVTLFEINAQAGSGGGITSPTLYGKDILGRVLSVVPLTGAPASYTYDGLGNLSGVNLGGQTRAFAYDALGHLASAANPENGATSFLAYDALGNLLRYRDAKGAASGYEILKTYDLKGRATKAERVTLGAASGLLLSEWSYDQAGHGFSSAGKLTHTRAVREDGTGTVETDWTYDQAAGRLGKKTLALTLPSPAGARSMDLQYRYNSQGQVSEEWFQRGTDFLFKELSSYAHGALASKIFSDGPGVQSMTYGVSGALAGVNYTNQTQSAFTQDLMGRTASIKVTATGLPTALWDTGAYAYDGAGNITQTGQDTFGYDALSRLTNATARHAWSSGNTVSVQVAYTYDNFGNMLTRDILNDAAVQGAIGATEAQALERQMSISATIATSGSVPTNRLASVVKGYNSGGVVTETTAVPSYDANGNMTSDGANTLVYDALNQTVTANIPSDGLSSPSAEYYFYDADGERAAVIRYSGAPLSLGSVGLYARSGAQVLGEVNLAYAGGQVTGEKAKAYLYAGTNLAATREGAVGSASSPPAVPNGTGGSTPLRASKADSAGSSVTVSFSTNCGAANHEILWGGGSQLPASYSGAYGLSGAACSIGASSPVTWSNVPDPASDGKRFIWFLVAATNGAAEGSWGKNSGGIERTGPGPGGSSGQCGVTGKPLTNTCGQSLAPQARGFQAAGGGAGAEAGRGLYSYSEGEPGVAGEAVFPGGAKGREMEGLSSEATRSFPAPAALQNLTAAFYAWDHLGTIRLVTNQDRAITERHDYEPFGVELRPYQNATANTHQYTGHERDLASGYDYAHFRMYASAMGRFMKPDNVFGTPEDPQSWNLYSYVQGNPVNNSDPTGHDIEMIYRLPADGDQGHIIIRVVDHNSGEVKADWSFGPAENAGLADVLAGTSVSGHQTPDVDAYLQDKQSESATLDTSEKIDATLVNTIKARKYEDEKYNLYSNNCAQTAAELIHTVDPRMPLDATKPKKAFKEFKNLVKQDRGESKDKVGNEGKKDKKQNNPSGKTGGKGPRSQEAEYQWRG